MGECYTPTIAPTAMSKFLIAATLLLGGCVSTKTAVKYGHAMYDLGYAKAQSEKALENLNLTLENSVMKETLRRKESEAESRERQSNRYKIMRELPTPKSELWRVNP